jgi:hypothetical protein
VRVLLDEQLPRQLAPHLGGHEVRTVQQEGWAGLKKGELLTKAEAASFQVFVIGDRNLEYQQNLRNCTLGVVVLAAPSNALEDLLPLIAETLELSALWRPGNFGACPNTPTRRSRNCLPVRISISSTVPSSSRCRSPETIVVAPPDRAASMNLSSSGS